MDSHTLVVDTPFTFEAGGRLPGLQIVYHCSRGGYHGQKVVWIFHALTANSDPADWWPGMVGEGKCLDPRKYFIVCCNVIGSCYGSTGPSSLDPSTGKPYYLSFPKVTVRDIVCAQHLVYQALGLPKIDFLVGSSIGGYQALEWSILYPDTVGQAVFMATLPRVTPWMTAFEESQRMALDADPTFRACASLEGGKAALECARTIALLSYRSEKGYNIRQVEPDEDTLFASRACSYHRHQGRKLSDRFDAYSYWYLSYVIDSHNVGRGRGGVAQALSAIKAKSTVVSIDTDLLFPPYEMEEMAAWIPGASFKVIHSEFGHDGFLLENVQIREIVEPILDEIENEHDK